MNATTPNEPSDGPSRGRSSLNPGARILGLISIRPGEAARAFLTFLYLFLVIGAYMMMKAVRNSLFIYEFGAEKLPYVMFGIAVLAGVFASFYIRLARRYPTSRLAAGTLLFFSSNILVFWYLERLGYAWLSPIFYIWAGLFGVVATAQVWMLANELFTTREAKRLFGLIGAGGILGGLSGAFLVKWLVGTIGTTNLMLAIALYLAFTAGVVSVLKRYRPALRTTAEEVPAPVNLADSLKRISRSNHLRLLAALVFFTAVATSTADLQFNLAADQAHDEKDALTAFFGLWYGNIQILSFLFQLFLTSRILKHLGVGLSLLLLPISLCSASVNLLATRSLWSAILLKCSDGSLKHSLDRSSREMMYLPLPTNIKIHAKLTIDSVMDRAGDGAAGLVQLLVITWLGLGLTGSIWTNFIFLGIWFAIALRLRTVYVHSLRTAMGSVRARQSVDSVAREDADARKVLVQLLLSGNEQQRIGALEWLAGQPGQVDEDVLIEVARNDRSSAVRRAALAVLLGGNESNMPMELAAGLEGAGQEALVSVIDLMVEPGVTSVHEKLGSLLDGVEETARLPLVAFTVRRLGSEFEPFARKIFDALLAPDTPVKTRRAAARTLSLLPNDSPLQDLLARLLEDPDPSVASAAAESAGRSRRTDMLPGILQLLNRPGTRAGARRALVLMGPGIVDALNDVLADLTLPSRMRRQVPAVLARIGSSGAISSLTESLENSDPTVRDSAASHLYRIRWHRPDDQLLSGERLSRLILMECDYYERILLVSDGLRRTTENATPASNLLTDTLEEVRVRVLDRIFRILAMGYSVVDIDRIRRSLAEGSHHDRSNALEFLDNTLSRAMKRRLVPLMELSDPANLGAYSRSTGGSSRNDLLRSLADGYGPWIGACALHLARVEGVRGLEHVAFLARDSKDAALREEAMKLLAASGL